jgi:hypothetical protein
MNLYVGENTHLIELTDLTLQPNGNVVSNATVTADIKDHEDNRPTGLSGTITLSPDANTAGRYEGTLDASVELELSKQYDVTITADTGSYSAEWTEEITANRRDF